jgi:hypothetical protein
MKRYLTIDKKTYNIIVYKFRTWELNRLRITKLSAKLVI